MLGPLNSTHMGLNKEKNLTIMGWHICPKLENCVWAERLLSVDESHETNTQPQIEYEQTHAAVTLCYDHTIGFVYNRGSVCSTYY